VATREPVWQLLREGDEVKVEKLDELLVQVPRLAACIGTVLCARPSQRLLGQSQAPPRPRAWEHGQTSTMIELRFQPCSLRRHPTKVPVWCTPDLCVPMSLCGGCTVTAPRRPAARTCTG
jgi:hypothetical protein